MNPIYKKGGYRPPKGPKGSRPDVEPKKRYIEDGKMCSSSEASGLTGTFNIENMGKITQIHTNDGEIIRIAGDMEAAFMGQWIRVSYSTSKVRLLNLDNVNEVQVRYGH